MTRRATMGCLPLETDDVLCLHRVAVRRNPNRAQQAKKAQTLHDVKGASRAFARRPRHAPGFLTLLRCFYRCFSPSSLAAGDCPAG